MKPLQLCSYIHLERQPLKTRKVSSCSFYGIMRWWNGGYKEPAGTYCCMYRCVAQTLDLLPDWRVHLGYVFWSAQLSQQKASCQHYIFSQAILEAQCGYDAFLLGPKMNERAAHSRTRVCTVAERELCRDGQKLKGLK